MNHLFRVAKLCKVHFPALVWVLREENGGIGGRKHFHYLLCGTRLPLTPTGTNILKRAWERAPGRGFSDVKVYDRALNGTGYVCKCLTSEGNPDAARYEVGRFGTTQTPPIFSNALLRFVAKMESEELRRPAIPCQRPMMGTQRAQAREKGGGSGAIRSGWRTGNDPAGLGDTDDKGTTATMAPMGKTFTNGHPW